MENLDALNKSVDELDLEIGRALSFDEFGSSEASDIELIERARRWFEINLDKLHGAVCESEAIREHFSGIEAQKRNELLAAIIDALLKFGGFGTVPIASLAARVIHYGVERLCPNFQK